MPKRLVSLHYTSPPEVGGLEIASWELASAASRASGWQGILVSGTPLPDDVEVANPVYRVCIPELSTDHNLNREIFKSFRRGYKHSGIYTLKNLMYSRLSELIQPGDVLVSFNCFSVPYNIALTCALWELTQKRPDFVHLTWTFDLAVFGEEYNWKRRKEWPWSLMWESCPRLIYAAGAQPIAAAQSEVLGLDPQAVRVIPAGTDPSTSLRLTRRITEICRVHHLFGSYPLLYLPARISSRKNIPKAVRVIGHLRSRFPNAHLVISGSLSPHDVVTRQKSIRIREFIEDEGLRDAVTVLEHEKRFERIVPFEDSMSMMSVCDGLIFTSRRKGFLIPILEATLHNLPIFVPRHGAIVSWAEKYVITYEENATSEEISEIIGDVFSNPKLRSKYEIRTNYSWDNIFVQHFARLPDELLHG